MSLADGILKVKIGIRVQAIGVKWRRDLETVSGPCAEDQKADGTRGHYTEALHGSITSSMLSDYHVHSSLVARYRCCRPISTLAALASATLASLTHHGIRIGFLAEGPSHCPCHYSHSHQSRHCHRGRCSLRPPYPRRPRRLRCLGAPDILSILANNSLVPSSLTSSTFVWL